METLVTLSRIQFGMTAMFHFLFVPLTIGMTWILVIMESLYVKTNNPIYKDMTKYWGKLFGINFAMGVTTGLTMEFQFGTNWAYYAHYVGDIFGAPLAIEGLMAFFLESTFIGLFFFGWDKLSKKQHLFVTILVAIGSNLSAFWILIANGWMMHPKGTYFNHLTHRMELQSFIDVLTNPFAWYKFFHTTTAGYVTASVFVLGISSYFLIKKRNIEFARKSFKIASIFGLITSISVVLFGDNSGIQVYKYQPSKLAAIEGIWHTEKAPAGWSLIGIPNQEQQKNLFEIKIPYAASLIIAHDLHTSLKGIDQIIKENKEKIKYGVQGLILVNKLNNESNNQNITKTIESLSPYLGYGLLVKKYTNDLTNITNNIIEKAANDTIPKVWPLYYTFRIMVFLGISFILLFLIANILIKKNYHNLEEKTFFLKWAILWIPTPWIAALSGWFVAEYGRQPWTIFEILPTYLSVSSLSSNTVTMSLISFAIIYSILTIIEIFLMIKYIKIGPESIDTYQKNSKTIYKDF